MELKKPIMKDEFLGVRLESEVLKALKEIAKKHKISKSEAIRQLILKYAYLLDKSE